MYSCNKHNDCKVIYTPLVGHCPMCDLENQIKFLEDEVDNKNREIGVLNERLEDV